MGNIEREREEQIRERVDANAVATLTEAVKHDADKVPLHLVDPLFIRATAEVLGYGEQKYDAWNWANGTFAWHRLYRAAIGHLMDWYEGEDIDPESGKPHLAHLACCIMFLMRYQHMGWGADDRPHMLNRLAPVSEGGYPGDGRSLPTREESTYGTRHQEANRCSQGVNERYAAAVAAEYASQDAASTDRSRRPSPLE
jgi:hypothetical protein